MRIVVVGAGLIGLATARNLLIKNRDLKITVLEKEKDVALHQSGRNSGVVHSGIYYKPGSLKALNCRRGRALLEEYCTQKTIPIDRCGKVIVATHNSELPQLKILFERGIANGVRCREINSHQIKEIEPYAAGIAGIHVPETSIVDYRVVAHHLKKDILEYGGTVSCSAKVNSVKTTASSQLEVTTDSSTLACDLLINCAGLFSDKLASLCGITPPCRIIPFRGEYYLLNAQAARLCKGIIYPVPDPQFPFLGVHVTRMADGSVECGPNAVFALSREGYTWKDVSFSDTFGAFSYGGFRKLVTKHFRNGVEEIYRSLNKSAFVSAVNRLIPEIISAQLSPAMSGVRAQAVDPNGSLVDDFLIVHGDRSIHVLNSPSPAATACLSIADHIEEKTRERLR